MKLFFLFGTASFVYITAVVVVIVAVINWRAGRLWSFGVKGWLIRSFIASFSYAGYIFLIEGEGVGIVNQNDSIIEIYQNGLPMYLFIFSFLAIIPATISFMLWAEKQPKKATQKPTKKK